MDLSWNFLYLLFFFALPSLEASSSHNHYHSLKSTHFTLYAYDIYNKTDFMIYPGIGGVNVTKTTAPFGSIFIVRDSLTVSPNQTSKAVGIAESFSITSTTDGLNSISSVKYTLDVEGHKGSFSIIGAGSNVEPTDAPVIGGTGDFMFVQGYVTYSLFSFNAEEFSGIFKTEFHLFWPPYAALATKG